MIGFADQHTPGPDSFTPDGLSTGGIVLGTINIIEKWKTDPRRRLLIKRLGSDRLVDGMLVEIAWLVLAYKGEPIPLDDCKFIENFQDWIDCGMGEIDGAIVKFKGAGIYSSFFEKQSANGSKGGRPAKPKETQVNPPVTQVNPLEPNHNPRKPSSSSSSSSFRENNNFNSLRAKVGPENVDNHDPRQKAELCVKGIDRHGPGDSDGLRKFVGNDIFEHVRVTCGWPAVREMKREFTITNLTKLFTK